MVPLAAAETFLRNAYRRSPPPGRFRLLAGRPAAATVGAVPVDPRQHGHRRPRTRAMPSRCRPGRPGDRHTQRLIVPSRPPELTSRRLLMRSLLVKSLLWGRRRVVPDVGYRDRCRCQIRCLPGSRCCSGAGQVHLAAGVHMGQLGQLRQRSNLKHCLRPHVAARCRSSRPQPSG